LSWFTYTIWGSTGLDRPGHKSGCHRLVPGHNLGEIECTGKLMPDKGNQGSNERHPASKPGALRDSNGNMRMQFSLEHKCPGWTRYTALFLPRPEPGQWE